MEQVVSRLLNAPAAELLLNTGPSDYTCHCSDYAVYVTCLPL